MDNLENQAPIVQRPARKRDKRQSARKSTTRNIDPIVLAIERIRCEIDMDRTSSDSAISSQADSIDATSSRTQIGGHVGLGRGKGGIRRMQDMMNRANISNNNLRKVGLLKEIKRLEHAVKLEIPRSRFQMIVKEISSRLNPNLKFQSAALLALQESTESFLVNLMENANIATLHCGRVTLFVKDIHLAQRIQKGAGLVPPK